MQLEGIAAIVTGGASGLGAATARELASRGARVVVADIADDKGKAVAESVDGAFAHVDVTSTDQIIAAVELAKTLGPLRALVNCAGTGWAARTVGRGGYETAHDLSAFRRILEINTVGTFDCIRIAATAMAHPSPSRTASAARSSTPRHWRPSTVRSARPRTRRPRAPWWA